MVSSYPLPEGFSEFDVFSLGSCLLVEGECFQFVLEVSRMLRSYEGCALTPDRTWSHPGTDRICWRRKDLQLSISTLYYIVCKQKKRERACLHLIMNCAHWWPVYSAFIHDFYFCSTKRSAGIPFKCGDSCRFLQSETAEDPQQFPSVQLSVGWHGHLHERHHRRFLQLLEVSDVSSSLWKRGLPSFIIKNQSLIICDQMKYNEQIILKYTVIDVNNRQGAV